MPIAFLFLDENRKRKTIGMNIFQDMPRVTKLGQHWSEYILWNFILWNSFWKVPWYVLWTVR